jgi:predicted short-subunit dehydrogenase-like oxidoreductase (DUF2520 family)
LQINPEARPRYHAAAVFASNYVVVLAGVARSLLERAGPSRSAAWEAIKPLLSGTLENLLAADPESALTGPVARADTETLRQHLAAVSPEEAALYEALARAAIPFARLTPVEKSAVEKVLGVRPDDQ